MNDFTKIIEQAKNLHNKVKESQEKIKEIGKENTYLFCIGKKGYEYFYKREYNIINHYVDFWADLKYNEAINIGEDISYAFNNHDVDKVDVIFNYFKNVGSQKLIYDNLLPLEFNSSEEKLHADILFEPSNSGT